MQRNNYDHSPRLIVHARDWRKSYSTNIQLQRYNTRELTPSCQACRLSRAPPLLLPPFALGRSLSRLSGFSVANPLGVFATLSAKTLDLSPQLFVLPLDRSTRRRVGGPRFLPLGVPRRLQFLTELLDVSVLDSRREEGFGPEEHLGQMLFLAHYAVGRVWSRHTEYDGIVGSRANSAHCTGLRKPAKPTPLRR